MTEVIGGAEIRVTPTSSTFESQLRAQLEPIIARVSTQFSAQFSRAGAAAATSFSQSFKAGLGSQVATAAPTKQLLDRLGVPFQQAGTQAGEQFGTGLKLGMPGQVEQAVQNAGSKASSAIRSQGEASGRLFGSGFGEGFAALAAFAIAFRVTRFFAEAVTDATSFSLAFAGVRKTVSGTEEQFAALEEQIVEMSRNLPIAADEIARIGQVAGQLGIPIENIREFSEVMIQIAASTRLTADEAAIQFARLANVTGTPLEDIDRLASVLISLGNQFAASEPEILKFASLLQALAVTSNATATDILGLSAGLVASGANMEAGSTAVRQTIDFLQRAARDGGEELRVFLDVTKLAEQSFRDLAQQDPAQLFVRFLQGLSDAGEEATDALAAVGLDATRLSRELRTGAGGVEKIVAALADARREFGENTARMREFAIFLAEDSNQLLILGNRIDENKRKLGEGLVPVVKFLTGLFANLRFESFALVAAFTGLAAAGFIFIRASNIFKSFGAALGAARVDAQAFGAILQFSQAQGLSYTKVIQGLKSETLVYIPAAEGAAASTARVGFASTAATGSLITFRGAFTAARAEGLGLAASMDVASAAVGRLSLVLKTLGVATVLVVGFDLLGKALDALKEKIAGIRAPAAVPEITGALLDAVEGTQLFSNVIAQAGFDIKRNLGSTSDALTRLRPEDLIPSFGDQTKKEAQKLDEALSAIALTAPETAKKIFEGIAKAASDELGLEDTPEVVEKELLGIFDQFAATLEQNELSLRTLGAEGKLTGDALGDLGAGAAGATGELESLSPAAQAASSALQALFAAQSAFQERVKSLATSVSGLTALQQKSASAAGGSAKDTLAAARKIADANKALADAREDAARRIAEAQRRLVEAEEDAARRILEARRRLEESRRDSTRSLRDAQEELQDFQNALGKVGGAQTPEDIIRLRELQQAVQDAIEDAQQAEIEGQQAVADATEEGSDRVAEARRKLVEAELEAADKIADALEKLARAHEDAAKRQGSAASGAAAAVALSVKQMIDGFRRQAAELNTFTSLMETATARLFDLFPGQDFAEAFLADLNEMGPEAIPVLKNIVGATDEEISKLGGVFKKQIQAAKKAADLEFKRFPPNFKQAIAPAINNILIEMERGVGAFELLGGAGGEMADEIDGDMQELLAQLGGFVSSAGVKLTEAEKKFLSLASKAETPIDRVTALKGLIESLKNRDITIDATINTEFKIDAKELQKELDKAGISLHGVPVGALGATITGPFAPAKAMAGFTAAAGQPILVGKHTAEELFLPSTAGAIFKHTDTSRILDALRANRGSIVNHITVNEVASDPLATARAVSFAVGSGAIR